MRVIVSTPDVVLRRARWSQLLFGLIALLLASTLPVGLSDGRMVFMLVHWYGVALVALWLVVAFRRPSRVTWAAAVVLCVYFVVNAMFGPSILQATIRRDPLDYVWFLAPVLILMATLAQISVGIRCWQARAIWTQRGEGSSAARSASDTAMDREP